MGKYQAEKYTALITCILIILIFIFWFINRPNIDHLSGFNISFNYASPNYTGTVTLGQIGAANLQGIYNFRWVESPSQEQNTSTLTNIADIMYDNPDNPKNMQKFDTFFSVFINGNNKLMITIPYNSLNNPTTWTTESATYVAKSTGYTVPLISPIQDFDFIKRIEFSLMQNQLENTGNIQYPLSNHLIISLYAEAANQIGTDTLATPDTAIGLLAANRITPCISFVNEINSSRILGGLEPLEIVFPMEVQPQIINSLDDIDSYDPYIFDLGNPAVVSRDYPMDNRTSQAYAWWSTSQYHDPNSPNVDHANIAPLLTHLQLTKATLKNTKAYISLGIYPIIWQMFNLKAKNDGFLNPAKQNIDDYAKLVKRRVDVYKHYIERYTDFELLISEFGWPGSCGGMCKSAGCTEDFDAMKPGTTHKQQKREQCIMWQVFKTLDVPKYYWTLGTDVRHSMCGNNIQQMMGGPGDDSGWRITDKNTGFFIC